MGYYLLYFCFHIYRVIHDLLFEGVDYKSKDIGRGGGKLV